VVVTEPSEVAEAARLADDTGVIHLLPPAE